MPDDDSTLEKAAPFANEMWRKGKPFRRKLRTTQCRKRELAVLFYGFCNQMSLRSSIGAGKEQ
jgi:hypothetical protein